MAKGKHVGIPRPLDELGRVVVAREYRTLLEIEPRAQMCQTLMLDPETGRVAGILLTPLEWIAEPKSAPCMDAVLERLGRAKHG